MIKSRSTTKTIFAALLFLVASLGAHAAPVNFSGLLDVISLDDPGSVHHNVPLGTPFSGFIDDATGIVLLTRSTRRKSDRP